MKIQIFNWYYDENSKPVRKLNSGIWKSYELNSKQLYELLKCPYDYVYIRI